MNMARQRPAASGYRCALCRAFTAPTQAAVEAHVRDAHPELVLDMIIWRDAEADYQDTLEFMLECTGALKARADGADAEVVELRPVAEKVERARRNRSAAAARSNRARAGRTSADDQALRRAVKGLDEDEDGRRRSHREIVRILQARGAPIGRGGNALAKVAKFRGS